MVQQSLLLLMEWQLCPLCQGTGAVSGGYFDRAGDCNTWVSGSTLDECRICKGKGIVVRPEGGGIMYRYCHFCKKSYHISEWKEVLKGKGCRIFTCPQCGCDKVIEEENDD